MKKARTHYFSEELNFAQKTWQNQSKKLQKLKEVDPLIYYIFTESFGLGDGKSKNRFTIAQKIKEEKCFNNVEITERKVHQLKWVALCYLGFDGREGLKRIKKAINAGVRDLEKGEKQMENEKNLRERIQAAIAENPDVYATYKEQCEQYQEDLGLLAILDAFLRDRTSKDIAGDFSLTQEEAEKRILICAGLLGCLGGFTDGEVQKKVEDIQANWLKHLKLTEEAQPKMFEQKEQKTHLIMLELNFDIWQMLFKTALDQGEIDEKGNGAILSGGYDALMRELIQTEKYKNYSFTKKSLTDRFHYIRKHTNNLEGNSLEIIKTLDNMGQGTKGHQYWIADPKGFEVEVIPNSDSRFFRNLIKAKGEIELPEKPAKEESVKAYTLAEIQGKISSKKAELENKIGKHKGQILIFEREIIAFEEELKKIEVYENIGQDLDLS